MGRGGDLPKFRFGALGLARPRAYQQEEPNMRRHHACMHAQSTIRVQKGAIDVYA